MYLNSITSKETYVGPPYFLLMALSIGQLFSIIIVSNRLVTICLSNIFIMPDREDKSTNNLALQFTPFKLRKEQTNPNETECHCATKPYIAAVLQQY